MIKNLASLLIFFNVLGLYLLNGLQETTLGSKVVPQEAYSKKLFFAYKYMIAIYFERMNQWKCESTPKNL